MMADAGEDSAIGFSIRMEQVIAGTANSWGNLVSRSST